MVEGVAVQAEVADMVEFMSPDMKEAHFAMKRKFSTELKMSYFSKFLSNFVDFCRIFSIFLNFVDFCRIFLMIFNFLKFSQLRTEPYVRIVPGAQIDAGKFEFEKSHFLDHDLPSSKIFD